MSQFVQPQPLAGRFEVRDLRDIFTVARIREKIITRWGQRTKYNSTRRNKPPKTSHERITSWLRPKPVKVGKIVDIQAQEKENSIRERLNSQQFELEEELKQMIVQSEMVEGRIEIQAERRSANSMKKVIQKERLQRINIDILRSVKEAMRPHKVEACGESGQIFVQAGVLTFLDSEKMVSLVNELKAIDTRMEEIQTLVKTFKYDALQTCYGFALQYEKLKVKKLKQQPELMRLSADKMNRSKLFELWHRYKISLLEKRQWQTIQGYLFPLNLIGFGGFSEVYLCHNMDNNTTVAAKIAIQKRQKNSEFGGSQFFESWKEQCRIQSLLDHPNIGRMLDNFVTNDHHEDYVSIHQLYEGPDLFQHIKENIFLKQPEAKQILRQILAGLEHMHGKGIIHFDLKTKNIMLNKGTVKIIDFGIAKQLPKGQDQMQLAESGVGTYSYLPKQALDAGDMVSTKVDIFSLGVVFYEMLYGVKPWSMNNPFQAYLVYDSLPNNRVSFPTDKKYRVSDEAKRFIWKCLELNVNQRYSTYQAINSCYVQNHFPS